jgi:hypothetical protein
VALAAPGSSGTSAGLELTLRGRVDGEDDALVGVARFNRQGAPGKLAVDFGAIGATSSHVVVRGEAGEVLTAFDVPNGAQIGSDCFGAGAPIVPVVTLGLGNSCSSQLVTVVIDGIEWENVCLSPIPGSPTAGIVGGVDIFPGCTLALDHLSAAEITAQGPDSLVVTGEAIAFGEGGHFHSALGQTTLEASPDRLTLGRFGTGGGDGVAIDVGSADQFGVVWDPFIPLGLGVSTAFVECAGGGPAGDAGVLRVTADGFRARVTADFSPLGSQNRTIAIFDDGEEVARTSGHTGTVADVTGWPAGCHTGSDLLGGEPTWTFGFTFDRDVSMTVPGGPRVKGDSLIVLAEDPSEPPAVVTSFTIRGSRLSTIGLVDEVAAPAP